MTKRNLPVLGVCLFLCWFLFSCGLENIPYMPRIPDPIRTDISGTEFRLPSGLDHFTHFVIFYRIYVSNRLESVIDRDSRPQLQQINSQLDLDVNFFRPWIDPASTTVNTAQVWNTFVNTRRFFQLELEGADINVVLGPSSLGGTLEIDFVEVAGQAPRLFLNGVSHDLRRAGGEGFDFDPLPEFDEALPFFNHEELRDRENRTEENLRNADVAPVFPPEPLTEAYVLMYIAAAGLSFDVPPRRVFSQPTFLGIFRLPIWQ